MQKSVFKSMVAAVAIGLALASTAAKANLLNNGDFETGDFAGWNVNASYVVVSSGGFSPGIAQSGTFYVGMDDGGGLGTISQSVTTTMGQSYNLGYWFASDGSLPNYFDVLWNGIQITGSQFIDAPFQNWTQFTFSVIGTGSDILTFQERNDAGYLALDNVSLQASNAVPEPGSVALLGLGLIGFAAARRRMR